VVAIDEKRVLSALASSQFDPASLALVSDPAIQGTYGGAENYGLQWIRDDPDQVVIESSANGPIFLVVADTYHSGWRATVDGKPSTIHRVNHLWRGIALPEGRHTVAMTYVPDGWTRSVAITRISGALWIGMVLLLGGAIIRKRSLRSSWDLPSKSI
jgi:hypothetical protein